MALILGDIVVNGVIIATVDNNRFYFVGKQLPWEVRNRIVGKVVPRLLKHFAQVTVIHNDGMQVVYVSSEDQKPSVIDIRWPENKKEVSQDVKTWTILERILRRFPELRECPVYVGTRIAELVGPSFHWSQDGTGETKLECKVGGRTEEVVVKEGVHLPQAINPAKVLSEAGWGLIARKIIEAGIEPTDEVVAEFLVLHEIGHWVDFRARGREQWAEQCRKENFVLAVSGRFMSGRELAAKYREQPTERAADEFALGKMKELRQGARGALLLCTVRDNPDADIKLAITRVQPKQGNWIWLPHLAPSEALFRDYLRWRKEGQWPARWSEYRARFVEEMKNSQAARQAIARIIQRIREGKTVALACFCEDERYCHRSIVGAIVRHNLRGGKHEKGI